MILWNPSPVLTDTLSPPSGERDGVRGAFSFVPNIVEEWHQPPKFSPATRFK
jgi:hypothetical protein